MMDLPSSELMIHTKSEVFSQTLWWGTNPWDPQAPGSGAPRRANPEGVAPRQRAWDKFAKFVWHTTYHLQKSLSPACFDTTRFILNIVTQFWVRSGYLQFLWEDLGHFLWRYLIYCKGYCLNVYKVITPSTIILYKSYALRIIYTDSCQSSCHISYYIALMLSPCLPHWPICSSSLCVMAR